MDLVTPKSEPEQARSKLSGPWTALPAIAADLIALVVFLLFFGRIVTEMANQATAVRGATMVVVVYLVCVLAVNTMKRLVPIAEAANSGWALLDFNRNSTLTTVLGVLMVVFFVWMQADLNGLASDTAFLWSREGYVHEGEIGLYYMFGPSFIWMILGVPYLAAFILKTDRRIERNTRQYVVTEFWALLALNLLMILSAGYLAVVVGRWGDLGTGQKLFAFLGVLVLLELLFDPPRLRHLLKNPAQWWTAIPFMVLLLMTAGSAAFGWY